MIVIKQGLRESAVGMNNGVEKLSRSQERRRELNRQAAQKLRNRQKEKAVSIKQEYFAAQSRNTQLSYEVKQLRRFKDELEQQVTQHLPICPRSLTASQYSREVAISGQSTSGHHQIQFLQSLPSGQLIPVNFDGNQVIVCSNDYSAGPTSSEMQVLTIAPLPAAADEIVDDVNDDEVANDEAGDDVAGDDEAGDDEAADDDMNDDDGNNVSTEASDDSHVDVKPAGGTLVNIKSEPKPACPLTRESSDHQQTVSTESADVVDENDIADANGDANDVKQDDVSDVNSDPPVENKNTDVTEQMSVDQPPESAAKSPAPSGRPVRRICPPRRSISPPAQPVSSPRHASRKRSSPVKRNGKSALSPATEDAKQMDAESNLPLTVSELGEDDC